MPVKLDSIPEELKCLVTENNKATVIIGKQAYEVVPLAEHQVKLLAVIFDSIISEVIDIFTGAGDEPAAKQVGKVLNKLLSEGKLVDTIHLITDEEVDVITANLTIPQALHILGVGYKQNLDKSSLPEIVTKNFSGLLALVQKTENPDALEFMGQTAEILVAENRTNSQKVVAIAEVLRMTAVLNESTKNLLMNVISRENIATGRDTSDAVSPEKDAEEG